MFKIISGPGFSLLFNKTGILASMPDQLDDAAMPTLANKL
jgi:hypothetical protein